MNCPYCGKEAAWVPNEVVYGRRYGESYMCYFCEPCDAYVGCHGNSRKPLGTMASKPLREWRQRVHGVIDPLWQSGEFTRHEVYDKLNDYFERPIHIAEADTVQCREIIFAANILFGTGIEIS